MPNTPHSSRRRSAWSSRSRRARSSSRPSDQSTNWLPSCACSDIVSPLSPGLKLLRVGDSLWHDSDARQRRDMEHSTAGTLVGRRIGGRVFVVFLVALLKAVQHLGYI